MEATSAIIDSLSDKENDVLPLLCQPDEEEAKYYYNGLPSCPRLVGRTSSGVRPWTRLTYDGQGTIFYAYPPEVVLRQATPIGGPHPALQAIEPLLSEIKEAIDALPWTCIDLLRIGLDTMPMGERPVILWIGLQPQEYTWDNIARALRAVRHILDAADLAIECEMRETDVAFFQTSPPLFQPVVDDGFASEATIKRPVSTAIGQEIFPASPKTIGGTLGIYVCPARMADPPIWGLTCRHVGLPPDAYPNTRYGPRNKAQRQQMVYLPSDAVLKIATLICQDAVDHERNKQAGQANDCEARARQTLGVLQQMQPLDQRAVGSVFLSPPISAMPGQRKHRPWTRDWALVDLNLDKFPRAYTRNVVDLRTSGDWVAQRRILQVYLEERVALPPTSVLPLDGFLKLSGVVPLVELEWLCSGRADREPPDWLADTADAAAEARERAALQKAPRMADRSQSRVLLVGKNGAKSGLTWVTVLEFRSVVRRCTEDVVFESRELAIMGLPGPNGRQQDFSTNGDSGAAVYNVTGRVVALLTGGTCNRTGQTDITYCTPFELILQDISKEVGEEVRLL